MVELAVFADSAAPRLTAGAPPPAVITGLYLHIPFCFHKCHYCDFYSITHQSPQRMEQFVDRILREAKQWSGRQIRPTTIFFGGGTPTLLPIDQMNRLLVNLHKTFDLSQVDEWTVEANPATVDLNYCQMLKQNGVNRISFGAQSFNPAELKMLERHHNPDDVSRSVEIARAAGFTRINVDLIFAIPGQDMPSWSTSLEEAISLRTPHISCYALTYEPNTPMTARKTRGDFQPADESLELEMLHHTRSRMTQVNRHAYEISNFAIPGEECRHNLNYWLGGNYIGLGPSAASHIQGWRWRNRPHLSQWESAIDTNILPAIETEVLTPACRAGELAMLMLRLERGINFHQFQARTGQNPQALFADVIDRLQKTALIEVTSSTIRLTPTGINVADAIAAEFLVV